MQLWSVATALVLAVGVLAPSAKAQAAGAPAPFRDCADCPQMVAVPGGAFQMGDATGRADEQPVHLVSVPAFAVGRYEVTRGEYALFVAATARPTPAGCRTDVDHDGRWEDVPTATWRDPGFPQTDRSPVVCVTWADASAYAAWLAQTTGKPYRLLSESEWEYAVRAGSTSQYWWGDSTNEMCPNANGPDQAASRAFPWTGGAACDDRQVFDAPVGSYRPNGFGLYDMAGNAWEWTQDCYAPSYAPQPRDGSAYLGGDCQRRALRGGSWVRGLQDLRSAQRNGLPPPWIHGGDIGFRVARAP